MYTSRFLPVSKHDSVRCSEWTSRNVIRQVTVLLVAVLVARVLSLVTLLSLPVGVRRLVGSNFSFFLLVCHPQRWCHVRTEIMHGLSGLLAES